MKHLSSCSVETVDSREHVLTNNRERNNSERGQWERLESSLGAGDRQYCNGPQAKLSLATIRLRYGAEKRIRIGVPGFVLGSEECWLPSMSYEGTTSGRKSALTCIRRPRRPKLSIIEIRTYVLRFPGLRVQMGCGSVITPCITLRSNQWCRASSRTVAYSSQNSSATFWIWHLVL